MSKIKHVLNPVIQHEIKRQIVGINEPEITHEINQIVSRIQFVNSPTKRQHLLSILFQILKKISFLKLTESMVKNICDIMISKENEWKKQKIKSFHALMHAVEESISEIAETAMELEEESHQENHEENPQNAFLQEIDNEKNIEFEEFEEFEELEEVQESIEHEHAEHSDVEHGHEAQAHISHEHSEHSDEEHGHDTHAHIAHEHAEHYHEEHGHEAHAHVAHEHAEHYHEEHGHEAHAHVAHEHGEHPHEDHIIQQENKNEKDTPELSKKPEKQYVFTPSFNNPENQKIKPNIKLASELKKNIDFEPKP